MFGAGELIDEVPHAYRLVGHLDELDDLDLDTELVDAAVVVEWGEHMAERLSADYLLVRLDRRPAADGHLGDLQAVGGGGGRLVVGLDLVERHDGELAALAVVAVVYSLVLGMSVPDVSGSAIANLEVETLQHAKPTFHGDTIYAETRVLDKVESKSKDDRGVVTVESKGFNQRGEEVCYFRRKLMVWKRDHAPARRRPYDEEIWAD